MNKQLLTEGQVHIINGLSPVADAFSGTVYSDVIDAKEALWITFIVYWGVGTTGTTTLTVIPCDDTTPSNRGTAVPFYSRNLTAGDVWSAATARAAAGFTTTAGSDQMYAIEVDPAVLGASGYRYVQLKAVESVNDPILGGIMVIVQPRYASAAVASMID